MICYDENGVIKKENITDEDCVSYIKENIDASNIQWETVKINTVKFGNNINYKFDFPATIYFDFINRHVKLVYDVSSVRPEEPTITKDCSYVGNKLETKYMPDNLIFEYYYSLFTFTYKANDVKAYNDCLVCLEYMKIMCDNPENLSRLKEQGNISVTVTPLSGIDDGIDTTQSQSKVAAQKKIIEAKMPIVKGIQDNTASILRCPNCGKIIANKGKSCPSCFTPFDDMVFQAANYLTPIREEIFYGLYAANRTDKDYKKFVYIDSKTGIVFSPKRRDEFIKDYFAEEFIVQGEKIIVDGSEHYTKVGNYIYKSDSFYDGRVIESAFFESYFSMGKWVRPLWFLCDGTVMSFDGNRHDSKIFDMGRYIRDDELIRTDMTEVSSGKKQTNYWLIVNGHLCEVAWVSETGFSKVQSMNSRQMVGSDAYRAVISKEEFFDNYPCSGCNARRMWNELTWEHTPYGSITVSGRCKKCNTYFVESEEPETIKKIAFSGSKPIPNYHAPAGALRYLDNPCPYCGAYQVRYAKWEDKSFSAAFWGFFSHKVHSNYKCDNCKEMWE